MPQTSNITGRHVRGGVLVAAWLAMAAGSFWWFTMKDLRPFADTAQVDAKAFDGRGASTALEQLLAAHPAPSTAGEQPLATIVHFWDSSCACSRFNEDHVQTLMASYRAAGVRLLVVDKHRLTRARLQEAFGDNALPYDGSPALTRQLDIPASPAAAVFDHDGQLAYFGPYSEGAACLTGNGDFVEQVLDKLLAGEAPRQINISAFGCFCDWQDGPAARA